MTANLCRQLNCPCQNPVEDDTPPSPRPYRSLPGRPMPSGWRERVQAEIAARKRAKEER